ncbi:MAG: hypothetical protein KA885_09245 [Spirochaetes bacterium]|nr:hypothetical protein [Spirochaetota bacterium]
MNNDNIFKKAKGAYLYDIKSEKFFDFRFNSAILGYSDKKISTRLKNNISNGMSIVGDSVFSRRFLKILEKDFSEEYEPFFINSLEEFIFKLEYFATTKNYNLVYLGERFVKYINSLLPEKKLNPENSDICVIDATEYYLQDKPIPVSENKINIINYYSYPEYKIEPLRADLVILPEFISGGLKNIYLMIKRSSALKNIFYQNIFELPSFYIEVSLNYYRAIKSLKYRQLNVPKLKWKNVVQKGRIFTFTNEDDELVNKFKRNNILINQFPNYNYLPLILEDYQKELLLKINL